MLSVDNIHESAVLSGSREALKQLARSNLEEPGNKSIYSEFKSVCIQADIFYPDIQLHHYICSNTNTACKKTVLISPTSLVSTKNAAH